MHSFIFVQRASRGSIFQFLSIYTCRENGFYLDCEDFSSPVVSFYAHGNYAQFIFLSFSLSAKMQNTMLRDALNSNEHQFVFTSLSMAVSFTVFLIFLECLSHFAICFLFLSRNQIPKQSEKVPEKKKKKTWWKSDAHKVYSVKGESKRCSEKTGNKPADERCKTIPNDANGWLVALNFIMHDKLFLFFFAMNGTFFVCFLLVN